MKTDYTENFYNYLKSKKLKWTPERKVLLETVFSIHKHFDVDELYEILRKGNKNISRATIYRSIPLLIESGLVQETFREENRIFYEHTYGHEHHDHMLCIKCKKIIEFTDEKLEKLQNEICKKHEFQIADHRLSIKGYCKKCSQKVN